MKVEKNARGWQIEPSTSREEIALEFLIEALERRYGQPVEAKDSSATIDSRQTVPNLPSPAKAE